MIFDQIPIEALEEVYVASQEQARMLWNFFLHNGGIETFREVLTELEGGERISIDINVATYEGKPVPNAVGLMLVMRAAVKTLAIGIAVENWVSEHHDDER